MPKFRKKPVVIEAYQIGHDATTIYEITRWCVACEPCTIDGTTVIAINTLEGIMTAHPGDWIIRGVKGEVYPIKNDIFLETYDPVD